MSDKPKDLTAATEVGKIAPCDDAEFGSYDHVHNKPAEVGDLALLRQAYDSGVADERQRSRRTAAQDFQENCDMGEQIMRDTAAAGVGPSTRELAEEWKCADSDALDLVYQTLNIAGNESPVGAIKELQAKAAAAAVGGQLNFGQGYERGYNEATAAAIERCAQKLDAVARATTMDVAKTAFEEAAAIIRALKDK